MVQYMHMEFQPKPKQEKTEEEIIDAMYQGVRPPEGYMSKTQEEQQAAWDAKKAKESAKFDPANVEQVEMFTDKDFE